MLKALNKEVNNNRRGQPPSPRLWRTRRTEDSPETSLPEQARDGRDRQADGRGQKSEIRGQRADDRGQKRDSSVGAAFQPR